MGQQHSSSSGKSRSPGWPEGSSEDGPRWQSMASPASAGPSQAGASAPGTSQSQQHTPAPLVLLSGVPNAGAQQSPRTPTASAAPVTMDSLGVPSMPPVSAPTPTAAAASVTAASSAAPAAAAATAPPAAAAPAAPASSSATPTHARHSHKSTTLIPGWYRQLSSQGLQLECQKVTNPQRGVTSKDVMGVLEMEVMKFVAYCGGVALKFRVEEVADSGQLVSWGLAATKPCPALATKRQQPGGGPEASVSSPPGPSTSSTSPQASGGSGSALRSKQPQGPGVTGLDAFNQGPAVGLQVDSPSRKQLYLICSTTTPRPIAPSDVITIDLAPREDRQPVILATLKLNDTVVLQASLPCSTISSLQLFPFVTVMPGMSVSLHKAVTPSPLFTWYAAPTAAGTSTPSEAALVELDTCVKYHTSPSTPATQPDGSTTSIDFLGSTTFAAGRHRWTVQLDNFSSTPTHIFVGVATASSDFQISNASSSILSNVQGPLRSIAGTSSAQAQQAAAAASTSKAAPADARAASSSASSSSGSAASVASTVVQAAPPKRNRWGAWVRLPGTNTNPALSPAAAAPAPPQDGFAHVAESTSGHCFVTVDLDLTAGYVRFFRNGHLIGSSFQGVTGPLSPAVSFVQAPSVVCQAGLVNLTKLKQLDLRWSAEKCSGDLRLSSMSVTKVSEVYGDYSTVLATQGFISGVHLWLVKVNHLSEPDSIFIGVCRGCMPLDQDPQDLRDRTYYLSNGVIRVGGRRVATNAASFTKGDVVGVVLDADQGEIVFFRNGVEQGRARGIRGRLYPFVSCDSEGDNITLLGSYTLLLNRIPRQLADMEWDTLYHGADIELSSNCLTATKTTSAGPSTVRGTILYSGQGCHEFHVILDMLGPDGVWVGVAPPNMDPAGCVGDVGNGWALHSDGDKRYSGREEEYTASFKNGDVLTVCVDCSKGTLCFSRNGQPLGEAFTGLTGPLVAAVTLASEESKVTIQNRPTVLNTGEYTGELRWDETRAGKDLHVIDGLTVTKMANEGGDYATVLGTLCLASGQHTWNVYINHVEDSNLFIGVTVGGHDLNADPQEMKHRTYYLSNGTIRVAGKLITRCAEPYAEGDLVSVQLDMEQRQISFLKNSVLQGAGGELPEEVWPYVSLDNIMDSITLHSSNMFVDLVHSLRWNPAKACRTVLVHQDGVYAQLRPPPGGEEASSSGQGTVLGLREYSKTEAHTWIVRFEQSSSVAPANFLVGVAPPTMDLARSLGEDGCGIGLDYFGYIYMDGRYFHVSNLSTWVSVAKPVRGSTAKHKGKALPIFTFVEGKCEVTLTLDLKEGTLKFAHGGRSLGTIAGVKGPLHAAVTLTSSKQTATLVPGPIGKNEHTNEELVHILKAKGCLLSPRLEAALMLIPRDLFVPRDRHREAFRDQKMTVRMTDGSVMTLPPPSFVATALERLGLGPSKSFLDVGAGTGYVTALAACLVGGSSTGAVHGIECVSSRLEQSRANMRALRERLASPISQALLRGAQEQLGDVSKALSGLELQLSNVLIPECTEGATYDALYCDASLSEEDLPMFLSLLKPDGRMVVIIEEEALLVTRSGRDPHDFTREVIMHVSGDFGELEDPTPWEVQEAIARIKDRERRKGMDQAKAEVTSLRSFEYVEMQQRVQAAMQRISELETMLQRDPSMRSPARSISTSAGLTSPARLAPGAPLDDTRMVIKDKSRRLQSPMGAKSSPRNMHHHHSHSMHRSLMHGSPQLHSSPLRPGSAAVAALRDSVGADGFKAAAAPGESDVSPSRNNSDAGAPGPSPLGAGTLPGAPAVVVGSLTVGQATAAATPRRAGARGRARQLLLHTHQDQGAELTGLDGVSTPVAGGASRRDSFGPGVDASTASAQMQLIIQQQREAAGFGLMSQVSMPQHTFDDLIDSMSVQMFTPEHIQMMVTGAEALQVENRDVYRGTYKGVRVRVWKVAIGHSVSYLELKRAYSKYCIAHPNICAVLGVCIQADPEAAGAAEADLPDDQDQQQQRSHWADQDSDAPVSAQHSSASAGAGLSRVGSGAPPAPMLDVSEPTCSSPTASDGENGYNGRHWLWVVEESFGEESLHARLERGLLSWQQVVKVSTDIAKALTFLQDLRRAYGDEGGAGSEWGAGASSSSTDPLTLSSGAVLSAYALRTIVTPSNVMLDAQSTKVSVLPALLNHLESALGPDTDCAPPPPTAITPLHCDMAYIDPHSLFSEGSAPSFYAFGVVLAQLLTEQGPLGLLSAVKEALDSNTLLNLIPRLPANVEMAEWAAAFTQLALKCSQPGGISSLESELLPALEDLGNKLTQLGSSTMSWEQVEEMLMLPLQPRTSGETTTRRWVRQDFRMRRKMFLDEVAKLAVEGPIHKIELRRARCFKDSIAVFAGKGHTVWRQPLKVFFIGEQGMDSGGVTREWFSALSSAIGRGSPELFWTAGPQKNQLYINPLSSTPSHLKKFHFIGMFMAKAIVESAARGRELGPITLNLSFCEPFWKLLLGMPLNLMDLQLLDPTEFRSLMSILDMDIDGLIFETFAWAFHHACAAGSSHHNPSTQHPYAAVPLPNSSGPSGSGPASGPSALPSHMQQLHEGGAGSSSGATTPTKQPITSNAAASPFSAMESEDASVTSIPLKPGGTHLKVTNHNKREYVLLKAHKMLVGTIEAQMTAIIDAFHSLIPRELLDKYQFTSMEMELLVCGEQRIDVQDLRRSCKYEDGYTGREDVIAWFWTVVEAFDDVQRRQLLQFWSGSDGMPAEGFGALDPAFHIVAVERMYDVNDTTARLPAAHTCFRQLDLPRYKSQDELKEKLLTAITIGQGYMALS